MSISTIKADLAALKSAVESRAPGAICHTFAAVVNDAGDVFDLFGGGGGLFGSSGAEDTAECKCLCDAIKAECEKQLTEPPVVASAGDHVGKIFPGDGSFLKAIIQLIITLAPLFIEPAPTP